MAGPFEPLGFRCGARMENRFMLAPLTNLQSHADGVMSEEEFRWLTMRAAGGFGITMTCAAHVQPTGQGFPGQLGAWSDHHVEGSSRLAGAVRHHGSLACIQLHHAGMRSPPDLIGTQPVCPSDNEETGARALLAEEIEAIREDFIAAAVRAERSGFDGVEVHGAHGYLLGQFLSAEINRRDDAWGGSLENRSRLLLEILEGIRARCSPGFLLGARLSPERFGMKLREVIGIAERLLDSGLLDFLDMSLWDVFKEPAEEAHRGRPLLSYFTELERGEVRLAAAGNLRSARDVERVLGAGADIAIVGRAAILHHDFPLRCREDPDFTPVRLPVSRAYLNAEGVSDRFVDYLTRWEGFVAAD